MSNKTTFKIYFKAGANQGSFAIDAIATTVQGDWTNSTDNFALLTVDSANAGYTESVLVTDPRVESFRK